MFCGASPHVLDPKSRVFVPKRIQDHLTRTPTGGLQGYLTPGEDACLYLFTIESFHTAAAALSTRPFADDQARAAKRFFFGSALPVELDSSGRILIPEELRELVGMGREVVIVGVEDRAEIWPAEEWKKYRAKHRDVLGKLNRIAGEPPASPGPGT